MEDDTQSRVAFYVRVEGDENIYIFCFLCKLFNGEPTIQALREESAKWTKGGDRTRTCRAKKKNNKKLHATQFEKKYDLFLVGH